MLFSILKTLICKENCIKNNSVIYIYIYIYIIYIFNFIRHLSSNNYINIYIYIYIYIYISLLKFLNQFFVILVWNGVSSLLYFIYFLTRSLRSAIYRWKAYFNTNSTVHYNQSCGHFGPDM